jgi:hypothetical protein
MMRRNSLGLEHPLASELQAGERYRLRFINITPADDGTRMVLAAEGKPVVWMPVVWMPVVWMPVVWMPVAKDGAELPMRYWKDCEAKLKFGAGETYDFAFRPEKSGKL